LSLKLPSATRELLADVSDGQDADRHGGETEEKEEILLVLDREPYEIGKCRKKCEGLFDEAVRYLNDALLHGVAVHHQTANEVALILILEIADMQILEFGENLRPHLL
jgi:hypothetical protein